MNRIGPPRVQHVYGYFSISLFIAPNYVSNLPAALDRPLVSVRLRNYQKSRFLVQGPDPPFDFDPKSSIFEGRVLLRNRPSKTEDGNEIVPQNALVAFPPHDS